MHDNDAIAAEVHRKAIENLTNEAAITLVRTSGSPTVTDAKDFCTSVLDASGEQLGLSAYVLIHAASSMLGTQAVIAQLAADGDEPRPGDAWILNDPYNGGAEHQADIGIISPLFHSSQLIGWAFANCHVLDVGGSGVTGVAPGARTIYEEGLRFPVTHAITDGRLEKAWERYIAANVRVPGPVINDIRSMIAANNLAQRKLSDIVDHFGIEAHREFSERNKALTEHLLRSRIAKIPDGHYEAIDFIEYDGHGIEELLEVRCRLTIRGDQLKFEFSGDRQIDAFVNGTAGSVYGNTMTMILTTLAYGDLPFNAGMWRPLSIDLGVPGTVVNAIAPAPVSLGHGEAGIRVGKTVKSVLTQAFALSEDPVLRRRVAGHAGDAAIAAGLFGMNDRGEHKVIIYQDSLTGVGGGAQTLTDGQDAHGSTMMAGCGLPDVETHEAMDPVVFLWRRIPSNNGGPGQLRGGQGVDRAYLVRDMASAAGFAATFNALAPVPGFGGGQSPATAMHTVTRGTSGPEMFHTDGSGLDQAIDGVVESINIKDGNFTVGRGDVVRAVGGGGAGLGDPLFRPTEVVARDVKDGYIDHVHAREAYGVVIGGDDAVDDNATTDARARIRTARIGRVPERNASLPDPPGLAVRLAGSEAGRHWECAACGYRLCAGVEDWRSVGTVVSDEDVSDRFARLNMFVRPRAGGPPIQVVDTYCPACASCLQSSILVPGHGVAAPRLTELGSAAHAV